MTGSLKTKLWRWTLKQLRLLVDAADEWVHAREVQFRSSRATDHGSQATETFDRKASAARERQIKKARAPRLRYQHGEFVRS